MSQLNDVKMQDCLSWWGCLINPPVWQRSLRSTQGWPVMGSAAKRCLDQPEYKWWQHYRKLEAEGKGDSPRSPNNQMKGHANAVR